MGTQAGMVMGGRHIFVLVESGVSIGAVPWEQLRQDVIACGGYLSLALVNGPKSQWMIRAESQPPELPSIDKYAPAAMGIGEAVLTQLVEAQHLIENIEHTVLHLYGGGLVKNELVDVLKDAEDIQLKVCVNSRASATKGASGTSIVSPPHNTQGNPAGSRNSGAGGNGGVLSKKHIMLLFEPGASTKVIRWERLLAEATSDGDFLSLALINGKGSTWVVPPSSTPQKHLDPGLLDSGGSSAESEIANSVTDRLFEGKHYLPAFDVTEIRLVGGSIAETDLYDHFKNEQDVVVKVYDGGRLRLAKFRRTPPLLFGKKNKTKPANGSGNTNSSAPLPSPSVTATTAAAGPNRIPAAPAGAVRISSPPPPPPPPVPQMSFADLMSRTLKLVPQLVPREHIPRRLAAGVLSAISFLLAGSASGLFSVLLEADRAGRSSWSTSFNAGMYITPLTSIQSHMFITSLVFALLVAYIGPRFHRSTYLAIPYGLLAGFTPQAIPPFLLMQAPGPIERVFYNINSILGSWLIGTPVPYLVVGYFLCRLAAKRLPPPPQTVIDARTLRKNKLKEFYGLASPIDKKVIDLLLIFGFTGVVPYLIGCFVLQDNILFTKISDLHDVGARDFWSYIPAFYLGGMVVLLALAGMAMAFQPWTERRGRGLIGVILLVVCLPLCWAATSSWTWAEQRTLERFGASAYPFRERGKYTCGHVEKTLKGQDDKSWLYQVWTASLKGAKSDDCNRLILYRGWERMGSVDLPDGLTINGLPSSINGEAVADAFIEYKTSDGNMHKLNIDKDFQ